MANINLEDIRQQSVASLLKSTDNVIKYLDPASRDQEIANLRAILLEYCALDLQHQVSKEALLNAEKSVNPSTVNDLDKHFTDNLKKMTASLRNPSQHEFMNTFNSKIAEISLREQEKEIMNDSDLIRVNTNVQFIDPISKKPIVNPMRNKRCSHVYEADSIKNLLMMNPRMRCPVAGCGDRVYIQMSNLEPDEDLRIRLTQQTPNDTSIERSMIDLNDSQ